MHMFFVLFRVYMGRFAPKILTFTFGKSNREKKERKKR